MRHLIAILIALALGACDPFYETQTCDLAACQTRLLVTLPAGAHVVELMQDGKVIADFDCDGTLGGPPVCDAPVELPLPERTKLHGITLRTNGQAWRIKLGPAVVEQMCAWGCVARYQVTLEPL